MWGKPTPEPAEGTASNGRPRESVWDYPRPPKLEREEREVEIRHDGRTIARSSAAWRICETAGPPVVYVPPGDVFEGVLEPAEGGTFCEWKGTATYFHASHPESAGRAERAAWTYRTPAAGFEQVRDHIAFYPGRVECYLGGERVEPQPGDFYGGWITAEITGPFKGGPGSQGW